MKHSVMKGLATLVTAAALLSCGGEIGPGTEANPPSETVKASVAEAQVTQEPFLYEAVGTITARTASTISAKLMGTVLAVHVHEGDLVKADDLLVTLDPRQVTAQLDKAQAALREARRAETSAMSARNAAKAAAELANATYRRYTQLIKDNSASQQEFDEVEARHRQAQAALAQAEAQLEASQSRIQQAAAAVREATLSKKDAMVRAPYDGQVVSKMVDEGDLASPGTPLLTVEQEGLFCADLVLPERHIQAIKVGQPVKVTVSALNSQPVTGKVGRIVPSADIQSRSFQVKVNMPPGLDLKSGMFARVFIPLGGTGMMLVPQTAVVVHGQLTGVFIVDQDHVARLRLVRTGKQYGDRVEIISGLQAGQRYVTDVPVKLQAGVKVEESR